VSVFSSGGGALGAASAGAASEVPPVSLNLTALMDILSNLLFFLLAAYTAQSLEVKQKPDLTLPVSSSQLSLKPSLTLMLGRSDIHLGADLVVKLDGGKVLAPPAAEGDDEDKIGPLFDKLRAVKDARAAAGRADAEGSDVILLLCDKSTDATLVTRVLKTAGLAGFVNVRFGVLSP
jgi:hypothetical protein